MFRAMGGATGCEQRFSKGPKPKLGARLTRAVVDPKAVTTRGDTATIPLSAVTVNGKPWSHDVRGKFMTLKHDADGWRIPDLTDAAEVTAPGAHF